MPISVTIHQPEITSSKVMHSTHHYFAVIDRSAGDSATVSIFYDSPALLIAEAQAMLDLADQLAHKQANE